MPNLAYYLSGCPLNCSGGGGDPPPPTPTQQVAVDFADATDFATLTYTLGSAGFVGFTLAGWFWFEAPAASSLLLKAEGIAGREAGIYFDNTFPTPSLSAYDSNGGNDDFADQPSSGVWLFMTFRGATAHPGTLRATWQAEAGGTIYTATHTNGIEDSLSVVATVLNAGNLHMRAQYVRGYASIIADGDLDALRTSVDVAAFGGAAFWNVFADDGLGGVAVTDATGNGRTFVLTGGTLTVDGPTVGDMP